MCVVEDLSHAFEAFERGISPALLIYYTECAIRPVERGVRVSVVAAVVQVYVDLMKTRYGVSSDIFNGCCDTYFIAAKISKRSVAERLFACATTCSSAMHVEMNIKSSRIEEGTRAMVCLELNELKSL